MYFLFILTGILLGAIIPAFNFDFLGWKGAAYYWIMLAFAIIVLGFLCMKMSCRKNKQIENKCEAG